jgi:hypothetical protein
VKDRYVLGEGYPILFTDIDKDQSIILYRTLTGRNNMRDRKQFDWPGQDIQDSACRLVLERVKEKKP